METRPGYDLLNDLACGQPFRGLVSNQLVHDLAHYLLSIFKGADLASHISRESNLDRFLIPKIPKTDLRSSQIVESDGTLGISKTKNVPIFYTYL